MVFSQTSQKSQSILKVVEIDRLKHGKSQQVNGSIGVVVDSIPILRATLPSPVTSTSLTEEFWKTEPETLCDMFHDTDCEFFQDLVQWCAAPEEEEVVQSIDSQRNTETGTLNTNTLHTPISPQSWDVIDANTPSAQAGIYNTNSIYPLSPSMDGLVKFDSDFIHPVSIVNENGFQEKFLDINKLPVVIGGSGLGDNINMDTWQQPDSVAGWQILGTDEIKTNTIHNIIPFTQPDDSQDMEFISVTPSEVERIDSHIPDVVINDYWERLEPEPNILGNVRGLTVNIDSRNQSWQNFSNVISTPDVLNYVEQLEKCTLPSSNLHKEPAPVKVAETCTNIEESPPVDYEPITPKSESHLESENEDFKSHSKRRRHDSEDSDETYTPYTEHSPRKYKRRKPNVPIKDMIRALEGSQQLTKARRGRPPKRRESTVSSVCSVDDNASTVSTHELKYRELRDKNNEASKRSRMNRKLKELQMEQLVVELEERNKKLRIRADMLEDMTKKLRDAFMAAVSQKKTA